jgi:RNA polymerase sigma factor (sigma-70 family)
MELAELIQTAACGDLAAFGQIVQKTQRMVFAAAMAVLRDRDLAMDAVQEAYIRAYRGLAKLRDPHAAASWLRRIAITAAQDVRRSRRSFLVEMPDGLDRPVLDEQESRWTDDQRLALASALLRLPPQDRIVCDRFYHGGWSVDRLAGEAGINQAAMRKRLQRIRDNLREDIEMAEQTNLSGHDLPANLPARIVELLAKPRLTDMPENPVGKVWEMVRARLPEYTCVELSEIVTEADDARLVGSPLDQRPQYARQVHRIDGQRFLRTSLTEPMLLANRGRSGPLHLTAAGKVYRTGPGDQSSRTRLEAFHQAEILVVEPALREWSFMERLIAIVESLFPGRRFQLEQWTFPLCTRMWEMFMQWEGRWTSVLAWGRYTDRIVQFLGNDPAIYGGIGVGMGLERLACLYYGIDDIRKVESARVGTTP